MRVGQAGLGPWGKNLARNFDDLAELAWLCDARPDRLADAESRFPRARTTESFEEMVADDELEGLAEILMRLFVSFLQYPADPPRSEAANTGAPKRPNPSEGR